MIRVPPRGRTLHLDLAPSTPSGRRRRALRRRAQRELLRSLAELRARENCELVLLSRRPLRQRRRLGGDGGARAHNARGDGRARLHSARQPRLFPRGRALVAHTPAGERAGLLLAGLRLRGHERPGACGVWGAAFTDAYSAGKLAELAHYRARTASRSSSASTATWARRIPRYNPVTEREIAATRADYNRLRAQSTPARGSGRAGETRTTPGPACPEGRGFDECGEKGGHDSRPPGPGEG